jgi:hypothetical protein
MKLILSIWPHITNALASPWSNIRSICYGLVCSMFKINISDYLDDIELQLRTIILPTLSHLLSSRESESKAGGLNILGSFCGLSYDFKGVKINKHLQFLQRNSKFVSWPIWQLVYNLQDDWDVTIKEASVVLVQLCAPRNCV